MTAKWLQQQERGSLFMIRLILWISLHIGRRAARLLIYPICVYFLVFFKCKTFQASKDYLTVMFNRPARLREIFRHFHSFGANILDRIYFVTDNYADYEVSITGGNTITDQMAKKQGAILLGSHVGSFECARAISRKLPDLRVRYVMYEENSQMISRLLHMLNPKLAEDIITLGDPDAILKVQEALERGEFVAILGDRTMHGKKHVLCDFLGRKASFPAGTLLLASTLKVPVILFFGLYEGNKKYDVHFEHFAESIQLDRSKRMDELQVWTQRYADRMEHYCRLSPYSWFNFYDFWEESHA